VSRNEHAVDIDRPPAAIFPYLVGSEQRLRWMGALAESEQVTDGEPGHGTRFRDVFEERGQRIEIDAEIVEWEPPERLGLLLRSRAFQSIGLQTLQALDGRTRLTTTIDTEYKSRVVRLMAGMITSQAQARLEKDMADLKELVERETAA
jgi:uncharacterized protein YndB with AHSA1/START domain